MSLDSPMSQDSTSQQRLHHDLPSNPWVTASDLPPQHHDSTSTGPPRPYTEVPGSRQLLNPTTHGPRLRHSIHLPPDTEVLNLPRDTESWYQEADEMEKRFLKAEARLEALVNSRGQ